MVKTIKDGEEASVINKDLEWINKFPERGEEPEKGVEHLENFHYITIASAHNFKIL